MKRDILIVLLCIGMLTAVSILSVFPDLSFFEKENNLHHTRLLDRSCNYR